jgi:hypothetical protein
MMTKSINNLWRPPADMPKPRKIAPKPRFIEEEDPLPPVDEICVTAKCAHVGTCAGPCCWLAYVNGKAPQREESIGDDLEAYDYADYNTVLAERMAHVREIHGEIISGIKDLRKKAITVLLDSGFQIPDVCAFFHCSARTIYRIKERQ